MSDGKAGMPGETDFARTYLIPLVILASNFLPVYGVSFLGWDILPLFLLYWVENLIIGFFTLGLILYAGSRQGRAGFLSAFSLGAFFTFHYGMFCMVHGVFIFELFGGAADAHIKGFFPFPSLFRELHIPGFTWAVAGIFAAEFFQTVTGHVKKGQISSPKSIMVSPYGRIVILHITILFGGLLAQSLGSPLWALLMLIILKTGYDFITYKRKTHDKPDTP